MKLRKLIGALAPPLSRKLVCERCGQSFACGASLAGCWCAEVKLMDEQRAELRRKFQRCLCRECLEEFAREGNVAEARREA